MRDDGSLICLSLSRADQVAGDGTQRCCGSGGRLHHGPGLRYHHLAGKRLYSLPCHKKQRDQARCGCGPSCLLRLSAALVIVLVCEAYRSSSCSCANLAVVAGPWLRAHGVRAAGPARGLRPAVDVDQAHAQQRRGAARSDTTHPTTAPPLHWTGHLRPCFMNVCAQACMRRVWRRMGGWWIRSRLRRRRCGSPRHCSSPTDDGTPQTLPSRTPHSHLGDTPVHCRMLPTCAPPVCRLTPCDVAL